MLTSTITKAEALLASGQATQALALTAPLAEAMPSVDLLSVHAQALKALGRGEEALAWDRRSVARFPAASVAWHNLAATLGDLGHGAEAAEAAHRAMALGLDAAQTWLVLARALASVGETAQAEVAFRQAIRRAPQDAVAPRELAELLWTARADLDGAVEALLAAGQAGVAPTPLILKIANLLQAAGQGDEAIDHLDAAAHAHRGDTPLALALADALLRSGEAERALAAMDLINPAHEGSPAVVAERAWIETALDRGPMALDSVTRALAAAPGSQSLLNARATAARWRDDPTAAGLEAYDDLVAEFVIETPPGWADLDAYLGDLAAAIARLHDNRGHPTEQSLQGGSQTTFRLTGHPDPAIQAFFRAIDGPLRAHMAKLGTGEDPVRRRNTGAYRIAGAWSVMLRPGDFHRDHIHTDGWLSSAFYIETPDAALARPGREGWLRFGQPPFPLRTPQPAVRHVRPQRGKLVLFPSYLWHGTEPFTTDERRMTIAFDVAPA